MKHLHEFKDSISTQIIEFAGMWYCAYGSYYKLIYNKTTGEMFYMGKAGRRKIEERVIAKWFREHDVNRTHIHDIYELIEE